MPLFLLLVVLPPDFVPSTVAYTVSVVGILLAELLRIWAVGYAGSVTRTRGDKVPALVHAGPYRFIRNPLYVANITMYTLAGVAFGFVYLSIAIFIYSCIQYYFIVGYEEGLLENTFGTSYERYREKVPAWFGITRAIESSEHQFDWQRSLRSERSTFLSMAAMSVVFLIKKATA